VNSTLEARPDLQGLPVVLLLANRKVVVIGAGNIASRKIEGLINSGAKNITVVAPLVSDEVREWEKQNLLKVHEREMIDSDLDDAFYVCTATEKNEVNSHVFDVCESNNIICNSADDPKNCSAILMSTVKQGDITVAISSAGKSPALAKWLRQHVQSELGPEYQDLMKILSEEREAMRDAGFSSEDANWSAMFAAGVVDLVKDGKLEEARAVVRWIISRVTDVSVEK